MKIFLTLLISGSATCASWILVFRKCLFHSKSESLACHRSEALFILTGVVFIITVIIAVVLGVKKLMRK